MALHDAPVSPMPRIIEESELAARLRLHRLQIVALLATGALLGAGLQALPPIADALASEAAPVSQSQPLPEGRPLELRMDTRLGAAS
jgi:hypothetical protein